MGVVLSVNKQRHVSEMGLVVTPEVLVLVVSAALLFMLTVLTVITQLGPQGIVVLDWLRGAMRWLVPTRNPQPSGQRTPGRRARKTQRRKERLAALKESYPTASIQEKEGGSPPVAEDAVSEY